MTQTTNLSSHWGENEKLKFWFKVSAEPCSLKAFGESIPCVSLSVWCCWKTPDVAPHDSSLSLHFHVAFLCVCACVCVQENSLLARVP